MTTPLDNPGYVEWLSDFLATADDEGIWVAAREEVRSTPSNVAVDFGDYPLGQAISDAAWSMGVLDQLIETRRAQLKGEFA